jgi:hypothetical protein
MLHKKLLFSAYLGFMANEGGGNVHINAGNSGSRKPKLGKERHNLNEMNWQKLI